MSAIDGLETFQVAGSGAADRSNTQGDVTGGHLARVVHIENALQSLSLNQIQERAPSTQGLSFDTEIVYRNAFEIGEGRPKLRMILLPEPVITIFDKEGVHYGVVYDDFNSLYDTVQEAEDSEWFLSPVVHPSISYRRSHSPRILSSMQASMKDGLCVSSTSC